MDNTFRAGSLDHIEILVPDRYEAAEWYGEMLGLEVLAEFEFWAGQDGSGPLMMSSDGGQTKLALFVGEPLGEHHPVGFQRVAFRVTGPDFLRFWSLLSVRELHNRHGDRVLANQVVDHTRSWSIYFCDPYGNPLEITTYDYDEVAEAVR